MWCFLVRLRESDSAFFFTFFLLFFFRYSGCVGAEPRSLCVAPRLGAHTVESCYSWQKLLGFHSTTLGLWHYPTLPERCLWKRPYPLPVYGSWSFQSILFGQWMKKVAESCTCRNKRCPAFHHKFPKFMIGSSYGTGYQEGEFGYEWLTSIVGLAEGNSASEKTVFGNVWLWKT